MTSIKHTACCAMLLVAAVGCVKRLGGEGRRSADYYPLAVGNRWTYQANFLGEQREHKVEIVREDAGAYADSQGAQITADAFGVRDQKRYLLREPLEPGRTWTNVVSVSSVEHYKVLEVGARCEVPAGVFDDCIRVEARNRVDGTTTLYNYLTFAAGVGLVRVEVVAQVGQKRIPQTSLELKEYHLVRGAGRG